MPAGDGTLRPPVAVARCHTATSGDAYVVSAAAGPIVAGLTVHPRASSADARLELEVIAPSGPLVGRRPVLDPGATARVLPFGRSATPGCYVARGRLPAGRPLVLRGLDTGVAHPVVLRLPAAVRSADALMRRVRAATRGLGALREVQHIAPRAGAPGVTLRLDYRGRLIRARARTSTTVSVAPGWRRYFLWMLPGGVSMAGRIGSVRRAGRRLAVVSGRVPDLGGFIRLLVDPRSGRVRVMHFLAAGHVMLSVYSGFPG
jgi:hypothetical protein